MRIHRLLLLLCFALLLYAANARAQTIGACGSSVAEAYLDANNVRARIFNNGGLFYRGEPHVYYVPRITEAHPLFATSLWIAGKVGNEVRAAATRYGPWEFWAGPIDDEGNPPTDCSEYDRLFKVSRADIDAYENGASPSSDLADWPVGLGAPTIDANGNMIDLLGQPFSFRKRRKINLAAGERPSITGDQSIWWIMNDNGNEHSGTKSTPLDIEVHGLAYAMTSSVPALENSTQYKFRIINRGRSQLDSVFVGIWLDPSMGNPGDDYIGSDSVRGMGFVYNSDNFDEAVPGYGTRLPALGVRLLEGPGADADGRDNDRDGHIDELGERLPLSYVGHFISGGGVNEDPQSASDYFYYLSGRWKNGKRWTEGLDGFNGSGPPTNFVFPGDPVTKAYWSDFNIDGQGTANPPSASRRLYMSVGPFSLAPGDEDNITFAFVWARTDDHLASVTAMKEASDIVKSHFDDGFGNVPPGIPPVAPVLLSPANGASEQPTDLTLHWDQDPPPYSYQVQTVTSTGVEYYDTESTSIHVDRLPENEVIYWRVRSRNATGYGEWSDRSTFWTGSQSLDQYNGFTEFSVVQNALGPLEPPDGAAAIWQGFPGTAGPTDRQQVGEGHWIVATAMTRTCPGNCGSYDHFVTRSIRKGWTHVIPNSFEIRHTAEGSLFYDRYDSRTVQPEITLPFELWNIGDNSPGDPSDDFRMIPALLDEDYDGWGITQKDHTVSKGEDDPQTDRFYWFNPSDTSPGTAGYDAWAADALAGGDPGGEFLGPEVMSRFVFVNIDGGDVSTGVYNQDFPEDGTVFRLTTTDAPPAPLPSAPKCEDVLPPGDISFYWQAAPIDSPRLLISRDSEFQTVISDTPDASPGHVQTELSEGVYFWKLVGAFGQPSEVWRFTIAQTVGIEDDKEGRPLRFEVDYLFPNPTRHSAALMYHLPSAQIISIEVFDILGRRVLSVFDGYRAGGVHTEQLSLERLASGSYYVRVRSEAGSEMRSVSLVK